MSDTIYSAPGEVFYDDLDNASTGLVGTLGVRMLRKSDGVEVMARMTSKIVEAPAGSGHYVATLTAPEERGEYTILWDTGGALTSDNNAVDDLVVTYDIPAGFSGSEGPSWTPTVADVAALIRARTKIPGGAEAGTFTDKTRVTKVEAERIIAQAVDHVAAAIGGDPCNDQLRESAGAASAMLAAILIEQSYWPESAEARGSSAARLESLFNVRMKSLTAAVAEECGGQGTGGSEDGNSGALAAGHFSDGLPLIGRDYPPRW